MNITKLVMEVTAAFGAIPIKNASVRITGDNNKPLYEGTTNELGRAIVKIKQTTSEQVYLVIHVSAWGFETVSITGCLLYMGMDAYEKIDLTPLPLNRSESKKSISLLCCSDKERERGKSHCQWVTRGSVEPLPWMMKPDMSMERVYFSDYIKKVASYYLDLSLPVKEIKEQAQKMIRKVLSGDKTQLYYHPALPIYEVVDRVVDYLLGKEFGKAYFKTPYEKLCAGSKSPTIKVIKKKLNRIGLYYPFVSPCVNDDETFSTELQSSVLCFQDLSHLQVTGEIDEVTIYRIYDSFDRVIRVSQLKNEAVLPPLPSVVPKVVLSKGCKGIYVHLLQYFLQVVATFYSQVEELRIDDNFGEETEQAVLSFQRAFGLEEDGNVGPLTMDELYNRYLGIVVHIGLKVKYPGYLLKKGIRGDNVYIMQEFLQAIRSRLPIPELQIDGAYGPETLAAVLAFQQQCELVPDGIIGKKTWERIVKIRLVL